MRDLSLSDIQERLNQADLTALPKLRLSVLRNVTVESIAPLLRYGAMEMGLDAQVTFGAYDNIFQETVGRQGGLLKNCDSLIVVARLERLSPELRATSRCSTASESPPNRSALGNSSRMSWPPSESRPMCRSCGSAWRRRFAPRWASPTRSTRAARWPSSPGSTTASRPRCAATPAAIS